MYGVPRIHHRGVPKGLVLKDPKSKRYQEDISGTIKDDILEDYYNITILLVCSRYDTKTINILINVTNNVTWARKEGRYEMRIGRYFLKKIHLGST